ncbi:hypothetical protein Tco_0342170, partial [Tanacetum coccineum]
ALVKGIRSGSVLGLLYKCVLFDESMALTEVEQDDWSMEFDAEHVHFGQDGLGDFDWSNKDDDKTNKVVYELHHKAKASPEVEM